MDKESLRRTYRRKRKELSSETVDQLSQRIARHFAVFLEGLPHKVSYLHIFLPIGKNNEVNTWHIIDHLRESEPHINIVVSKSNLEDGSMQSFLLKDDTELAPNELDIPEPVSADHVEDHLIDLVVMPLLTFDRNGDRVGYGAGFYDKFLEHCPDRVLKVGVSFFEPVEKIMDVGDHDIVLDHCITPDTVHDFQDRDT